MKTKVKSQSRTWLRNLFYEYQILRRFGWEIDYVLEELTKEQMLDMLKELTILDDQYNVIHYIDPTDPTDPDDPDDPNDSNKCPDAFEDDWIRTNKPSGILTPEEINKNSWKEHFLEKYKGVDFNAMEEKDLQELLDSDGFFKLMQYDLIAKYLSKDMLIYYLTALGFMKKDRKLTPAEMKNMLIKTDIYLHEDEEKLAYIPLLLEVDEYGEYNKKTVFDISYKIIFRGTDVNTFSHVQTYLNDQEQFIIKCDDETETSVDVYTSYDYDKKGFVTYEWTNYVVTVRFRYAVKESDEQVVKLGWGLYTTKRSPELKVAIGDIVIKGVK